jgi:hypothetical protein
LYEIIHLYSPCHFIKSICYWPIFFLYCRLNAQDTYRGVAPISGGQIVSFQSKLKSKVSWWKYLFAIAYKTQITFTYNCFYLGICCVVRYFFYMNR